MHATPRDSKQDHWPTWRNSLFMSVRVGLSAAMLFAPFITLQLYASNDRDTPNPGFVTEFSASLDDVLQALKEVLQDETIHGTLMFEREQTLTGAIAVESTPLFAPWKGGGKVFYKIRTDAIAPRHFQGSADQGTIGVRYIVTSVSPERTRLRIDAIFVETARRKAHPSDGTVESSECKTIQDHLQAIQFAEQEAADAQRRRASVDLARQTLIRQREDETALLAAAQSSVQDLEQRIDSLQHEIERRIKAPGASLKAAPFRSAANVANLPAYTEVVILIVTPRWYGVETPNGQHGWLPLDQTEPLP
jgi:uncharacterized small protein (DUF1192 family)